MIDPISKNANWILAPQPPRGAVLSPQGVAWQGKPYDMNYLRRTLLVTHVPPIPASQIIMKTVSPLLFLFLASFVAANNDSSFDINSGVQTQQDTDALGADKLSYTTGGGVPSVHSVLVDMAISNCLSQCPGPSFRVTSWARRASSIARFSLGLFLSGGSFNVNVLTDIQIESLAHFDRERIV